MSRIVADHLAVAEIPFDDLWKMFHEEAPVDEHQNASYPHGMPFTAEAPSVWHTLRIGERAHFALGG